MMPSVWQAYKDIDPKAPKAVFEQIINAALISQEDRKTLVQALLTDVKNDRFPTNALSMALVAVKTLARIPAGSEVLIKLENLRTLYELAKDTRPGVATESLKCVANAILLLEPARDEWLHLGGGQLALDLLVDPNSTPEFSFLSARILFLTTMKQSTFLRRIAEDSKIIEAMAARIDALLTSVLSSQPMSKEAMVDTLKLVFNLLLQYPRMVDADPTGRGKGKEKAVELPKVMGEQWDEKFEPLVTPLLRVFCMLPETKPPLAAPLTHVIHALINVPVAPYSAKWFTAPSSPILGPTESRSTIEVFQKALSRIVSPRRSKNRSNSPTTTSSPSISSGSSTPAYDVVRRACDLVDATLAHYFPSGMEADDPSIRENGRTEGVNIDELVTPLFALITRIAEEPGARAVLKEWILPAHLSRDTPLEAREDTLGRCVRLLSSVYFHRLKDTIGEMFFTICNSDGSQLSAQIGYGNAAGYLFNRGILSAPPPKTGDASGADSAFGAGINPITGAKEREVDPGPEMTDEEKELEAEKLFVLFDRLEKTGMVQNPIRKAIQEGKLSLGPFGP